MHGRIEPSHVVLATSGQPMLCGFAGGGHAGTIPPASPQPPHDFCDPAASIGVALDASIDVFGIGALLRTLVLDSAADLEPIPEQRWTFARLRKPWSGYQRRALLNLSDQATDEEPLRRPPARRLAAAIRDTMPGARLAPVREPTVPPLDAATDDDPFASLRPTLEPPDRTSAGRVLTLVAGSVGLALFLFGLSSLRGGSPAPTYEAAPTTAPAETSAAIGETTEPTSAPSPTAMHSEADRVVVVGDARYEVGQAGDIVTVGDWDCDGEATPAVLRPSTGEIFVFEGWAAPGVDAQVAPTDTVPGALDLSDDVDSNGCPVLVVTTADGAQVEVPT